MTWNIPSLGVGETTLRSLRLVVTDADGHQASASRLIRIRKVEEKPPSPMCQKTPWLQQCHGN